LIDGVYKKLIDKSIEKYSTVKKLSLVINEKSKNYNNIKKIDNDKLKLTYQLGRKLTNTEINCTKDEYRGKTKWKH
jgi:hypothetical protein